MFPWDPDAPDNFKFYNDSGRILAVHPTDTDDRFVALTQWPIGSHSWGRMVLTSERVLKVEFTAGPPPSNTDGFFPRHAAAEITRWTDFSLKNPTVGVSEGLLDQPTRDVLESARQAALRRLRSPLSARGDTRALNTDPQELTGGEIAFLYDALVRLGEASPTEMLAEKMGLSAAAARNRVYRARKQGLLSRTRRGEPGGWMTPQGWEEAQRGPHFSQLASLVDDLLGRG